MKERGMLSMPELTDRKTLHTYCFDGLRAIPSQSPGLHVRRAADNTWTISIEHLLILIITHVLTYSCD